MKSPQANRLEDFLYYLTGDWMTDSGGANLFYFFMDLPGLDIVELLPGMKCFLSFP